jgi:hypothetical protein
VHSGPRLSTGTSGERCGSRPHDRSDAMVSGTTTVPLGSTLRINPPDQPSGLSMSRSCIHSVSGPDRNATASRFCWPMKCGASKLGGIDRTRTSPSGPAKAAKSRPTTGRMRLAAPAQIRCRTPSEMSARDVLGQLCPARHRAGLVPAARRRGAVRPSHPRGTAISYFHP